MDSLCNTEHVVLLREKTCSDNENINLSGWMKAMEIQPSFTKLFLIEGRT